MTTDIKAGALAFLFTWILGAYIVTRPETAETVRPDELCVYSYSQRTITGSSVWVWRRNWVCEEQGGWEPKRLAGP